MAVLKNSAKPNFFAILISYSVLVECFSKFINFVTVFDSIAFIAVTHIEVKNPRALIITVVDVEIYVS